MVSKKTGLIEVNGELLLLGEDPQGRGHWYQYVGGRLIKTTFAKLMYDLPDTDYTTPIEIGDKVRIGPYWFKFLGWLGEGGEHIILFKLRGFYVSKRWTAEREWRIRLGDWFNFLALRLARKLYDLAVKNAE